VVKACVRYRTGFFWHPSASSQQSPMSWLKVAAFLLLASRADAAKCGTFTQVSSFSLPKAPSGLFYYPAQDLLYILCGTSTNSDHYLYAFNTAGVQQCLITIPEAAGMSRVDGFQIVGGTAYIVDSQGPMWSSSLGGSVYSMPWTNPCGCSSAATCTNIAVEWAPTVTKKWTFSADAANIADGGGNDAYFRNSGIVAKGDYMYAVNGVHPNPDLTCCYPKSLIKVKISDSSVAQKWSFTEKTLGHDIDMEGLTCGADDCATHMYIGDEYNYIYKLNLTTSDPALAVEEEWDISSAVGDVSDDKGIESLAYASTTGYFYAGIQETSTVHVLKLASANASANGTVASCPARAAKAPPALDSKTVVFIVVAVVVVGGIIAAGAWAFLRKEQEQEEEDKEAVE